MDSNHRYRIRNNLFWLPPFGPAIRLPQQKPALSCRGPMVRIHLPPAPSQERTDARGLRTRSLGFTDDQDGTCHGFSPDVRIPLVQEIGRGVIALLIGYP